MFAANLGLLYELTPGTRLGLTWNSQVDLDFDAPAEFSNLAPGLSTVPVALGGRGDLVGSYDGIATLFLAAYFNWMF
jgi:long-subunit fatty acid transport protein